LKRQFQRSSSQEIFQLIREGSAQPVSQKLLWIAAKVDDLADGFPVGAIECSDDAFGGGAQFENTSFRLKPESGFKPRHIDFGAEAMAGRSGFFEELAGVTGIFQLSGPGRLSENAGSVGFATLMIDRAAFFSGLEILKGVL